VDDDRSCSISLSSSPLHIGQSSSSSAHPTPRGLNCGTKTQPWILESPAGQRITLGLMDFTPTSLATPAPGTYSGDAVSRTRTTGSCTHPQLHYGYILDKSVSAITKKNVSICGGESGRKLSHVYSSASNVLELVISHQFDGNNSSSAFLIRVEGRILNHYIQ